MIKGKKDCSLQTLALECLCNDCFIFQQLITSMLFVFILFQNFRSVKLTLSFFLSSSRSEPRDKNLFAGTSGISPGSIFVKSLARGCKIPFISSSKSSFFLLLSFFDFFSFFFFFFFFDFSSSKSDSDELLLELSELLEADTSLPSLDALLKYVNTNSVKFVG